jgi:ribose transport system substrate-binding protein
LEDAVKANRFLAIVAAFVILSSCDDQSSKAPANQSTPHIALVIKTLANPFFVEMEVGARRAAAETGIQLDVKAADKETSVDQQVALVEELIQEKVNAIVLAPSDSHKLVPVVKKARDAGITVINLDNRLDVAFQKDLGLTPVPFISVDNVKGAFLAAQTIARTRNPGPVEAAVIEGIRNAVNAQARKIGALKAFSANPDIQIVAMETANWQADDAAKVTQTIFTDHPNIKLLFCANDTMALGAISTLHRMGITGVAVAGFDAIEAARKAVEAGEMTVTIDQQAGEQGYLGIKMALAALHGDPVAGETQIDVKLVTASSQKPNRP